MQTSHKSNYGAECLTVRLALRVVVDSFCRNVEKRDLVVFSNVRSVLGVLKGFDRAINGTYLLGEAVGELVLLNRKRELLVTLQWVPAHCGFESNDTWAVLAKYSIYHENVLPEDLAGKYYGALQPRVSKTS